MNKTFAAVRDWAFVIAGSLLIALSLNLFVIGNSIASGGFTGIALILNWLFGLPVGSTVLLLNAPALLISSKILGRDFLVKTLVSVAVLSWATDVFSFLPSVTKDSLLACLYAGMLSGIGAGTVFLGGGSSGGSDVLGALLIRVFKNASRAKLILVIDAAIVALGALAFKSIESALYAAVMSFTISRMIDLILSGERTGLCAFIVTVSEREMIESITGELEKTATVVDAHGAYQNKNASLLVVVIKPNQRYSLLRLVHEKDPNAFVWILSDCEVTGEGFAPLLGGR